MLGRKSSSSIDLPHLLDTPKTPEPPRLSLSHSLADMNASPHTDSSPPASTAASLLDRLNGDEQHNTPPSAPRLHHSANQTIQLTVDEALEAARQVRPHVYEIINYALDTDMVHLIFNGCSGRPGKEQKQVAKKMNEVIGNRAMIGVGLGDNIYGESVTTPDAPCFKEYIYDTYASDDVPNLRRVKWFHSIGNHERNEDTASEVQNMIAQVPGTQTLSSFFPSLRKYVAPLKTGDDAEVIVRAHTYLHRPGDPLVNDKRRFYESTQLNYALLSNYNMPTSFFSFVVGDLQVFNLNSNYFVHHYYKKLKGQPVLNNHGINQVSWFEREFAQARAAGRMVIVALHHHFVARTGRYYYGDADKSVPDLAEREELNRHFGLKENSKFHHLYLSKIFAELKTFPDVIVNAHNHLLEVDFVELSHGDSRGKTCVVTCGGGGGLLQPQLYYGDRESQGMLSVSHGFVTMSCQKSKPTLIQIDTYNIEGNHLRFTQTSGAPLREPDIGPVKVIRELFLKVCGEYQDILHAESQTGSNYGKFLSAAKHPASDIVSLNEIVNYLNQPKPDDYRKTISCLHAIFLRMRNMSNKDGLYQMLNLALINTPELGGKTLQELHTDMYNDVPVNRPGYA